MKYYWWKILAIVLLVYTIIAGFLIEIPELPILHQTIRNLFFHVCMWFSMIIILFVSFIYSIKYLAGFNIKNDIISSEAAHTAMLFGVLGIITGMIWAKFTWGDWWTRDPKLNGAAVSMLIYLAYFVLRSSIEDLDKRAKVSAVYNIFAFVLMIVFIGILPNMAEDSLHPGRKGSTVIELDSTMRLVFYPAILGWTLLGAWILNLKIRIKKIKYFHEKN